MILHLLLKCIIHSFKECRDRFYTVISSSWDQILKGVQFSSKCGNSFFLFFCFILKTIENLEKHQMCG